MRRRIILIGLDGVSLTLLKRAINLGWMPNLKHMLNNSRTSIFEPEAVFPPYTPAAWTSILTGANPGKHGIFGFYIVLRRDKGFLLRLANALDVGFPRVFEVLPMIGLKTFVYNVPLTYSTTYSHHTVLIPGWTAPKPAVAHNRITMINRIRNITKKLQMFARWDKAKDLCGYLNELSSLVSEEVALLCELLEHLDWVLSVIILSELDWIQHRIPKLQRQDIQRVRYLNHIFYSVDHLIARAVKLADFVFIVSDHGFREYSLSISVNEVLRKAGLLKVSGNSRSHKGFSERLRFLLRQQASQAFAVGKVLKLLDRILGYGTMHDTKMVKVPEIDTEHSYAAMFENSTSCIYCNKDKRETVKQVLSILVKTGLVREIREGNSMFTGPYSERGPDFVLIPHDSVWPTNTLGKLISQSHVDHSFKCILLIHGDDLHFDRTYISKLSILDVAPTILWLLGIKPHPLHDGKVMNVVKEQVNIKTKYSLDYVTRYMFLRKLHSVRSKLTKSILYH